MGHTQSIPFSSACQSQAPLRCLPSGSVCWFAGGHADNVIKGCELQRHHSVLAGRRIRLRVLRLLYAELANSIHTYLGTFVEHQRECKQPRRVDGTSCEGHYNWQRDILELQPRKLLPLESMKRTALILSVLILSDRGVAAPFQNLGFEEANTNSLVFLPGGFFSVEGIGPISDLLPGWQLFLNTNQVTILGFNHYVTTAFENRHSLVNTNARPSMEGRYMLYLHRPSALDNYYLSQRGDIPAEARFLTFTFRDRPFAVTINGEQLTGDPFQLPSESASTVQVDVSRFAGQTVELTFRTSYYLLPGGGDHELDAIAFIVPEPTTLAFVAVGIAVLACRWRRHRQRYQ